MVEFEMDYVYKFSYLESVGFLADRLVLKTVEFKSSAKTPRVATRLF